MPPYSSLESPPTGRPTPAAMTEDGTVLLAIGELARASGRTVRTIRQPAPPHPEDFARVVAALPAHTAR